MKTTDPLEAVRCLFNQIAPQAPQLSPTEVREHLRDWAGGDDAKLLSGSRQYVEPEVIAHFQALRLNFDFEFFRIEYEPRWRCVFAKSFYSGVVNFLLVWRQGDEFSVTATGDFPAGGLVDNDASVIQKPQTAMNGFKKVAGLSRFWRCPGCGVVLQKKPNPAPGTMFTNTIRCGGCNRGYERSAVVGGAYDLAEIEFTCPWCATQLRGPGEQLLGKPCPACSRILPSG